MRKEKRSSKALLAVMIMTAMIGVLGGCGEKQSIAGHWEYLETRWGDGYYSTYDYYADRGIYMSFDFDDLHTGVYYYYSPDEDYSIEFSYSHDEEYKTFWFETSEMPYEASLKGDELTYVVDEDGKEVTYVFVRDDDQ